MLAARVRLPMLVSMDKDKGVFAKPRQLVFQCVSAMMDSRQVWGRSPFLAVCQGSSTKVTSEILSSAIQRQFSELPGTSLPFREGPAYW